jgi:pyruvate dehydrogenase E2 component (dihydrolipoamide acetyltransferase)
MAEVVRMPKMSDTMTEGVIAKWHKKVGDKIKTGDLVADIETDKATMEFESYQEGTLLYTGIEEGKAAPVDAIIAILGKEGEDYKSLLTAPKASEEAPKAEPAKEAVAPKKEEVKIVEAPKAVAEEKPVQTSISSSTDDGRLKASPLARKLAMDKGIDIGRVQGSGENGRIVKRDIDWYKPGASVSGGNGNSAFVSKESFEEIPVSQMRKTIARRLAESKFSAPHFYLTMDIDMDKAVEARESINSVVPVKISFNDLVIKATASALQHHPKINSSWLGDKIRYNHHIHIGVAMAVEEGLLVPVIRFADGKTLSQIASEVKVFSQKAKSKKLQPADWEGNTFTISNLGMFGIDSFTAIINSPDACILAIGGIKQIPVVKNNQIQPGHVMKVTLSCDHRVVDGASGAAFLKTLKQMLENPVLMLGQSAI